MYIIIEQHAVNEVLLMNSEGITERVRPCQQERRL